MRRSTLIGLVFCSALGAVGFAKAQERPATSTTAGAYAYGRVLDQTTTTLAEGQAALVYRVRTDPLARYDSRQRRWMRDAAQTIAVVQSDAKPAFHVGERVLVTYLGDDHVSMAPSGYTSPGYNVSAPANLYPVLGNDIPHFAH